MSFSSISKRYKLNDELVEVLDMPEVMLTAEQVASLTAEELASMSDKGLQFLFNSQNITDAILGEVIARTQREFERNLAKTSRPYTQAEVDAVQAAAGIPVPFKLAAAPNATVGSVADIKTALDSAVVQHADVKVESAAPAAVVQPVAQVAGSTRTRSYSQSSHARVSFLARSHRSATVGSESEAEAQPQAAHRKTF